MAKAAVNVDEIDGLDDFVIGEAPPKLIDMMQQSTVRPAFRLEKLKPYKRVVRVAVPKGDKQGFDFVDKEIIVEGGFMVHCLRGHSVRIDDIAQLEQYKLGQYVPMIKGDDAVGAVPLSQVTHNAK